MRGRICGKIVAGFKKIVHFRADAAGKTDYAKQQDSDPQLDCILAALGGRDNIENIDCCATRLRLNVVNVEAVNKDMLKLAGAVGVIIKDKNVQVVFGPQVGEVKTRLAQYISR
jgi:glucose-like phosphotransferase system IIB component